MPIGTQTCVKVVPRGGGTDRPKNWLSDWLCEWQTDHLTECLIEGVSEEKTYWPNDWLTEWLTDWWTGWLVGWLVKWHTEGWSAWPADWVTAGRTHWLTDWLMDWFIDWWTVWLSDGGCPGWCGVQDWSPQAATQSVKKNQICIPEGGLLGRQRLLHTKTRKNPLRATSPETAN